MVTVAQEVEFQTAQAAIRAAVEGQLTAAIVSLGGLAKRDPVSFRDVLIGVAQAMVAQYGQAAAVFAADWYDELRASERVAGAYKAVPVTRSFDVPVEQTVRRAVGTLFTDTPDLTEVTRAVSSKVGQYTVDGMRNTVLDNSIRDPRASGWKRVAHGETCDFCLMLVGRGGVYKESTVRFKSHGGCNCTAAPSWDPFAPEVPTVAYEASGRGSSRGVAAWIESHRDELDKLREQLSQ